MWKGIWILVVVSGPEVFTFNVPVALILYLGFCADRDSPSTLQGPRLLVQISRLVRFPITA